MDRKITRNNIIWIFRSNSPSYSQGLKKSIQGILHKCRKWFGCIWYKFLALYLLQKAIMNFKKFKKILTDQKTENIVKMVLARPSFCVHGRILILYDTNKWKIMFAEAGALFLNLSFGKPQRYNFLIFLHIMAGNSSILKKRL